MRKSLSDGGINVDPEMINQAADAEFKRLDRNGDGKLNEEEMPPGLKANLQRWDKDGNKLIDMNEFREYYMARIQGSDEANSQGARGIAAIIIDEEDLDRKPVVYRVGGAMPPGLPDWFQKLDTDKDGMVALYEWREAKKPMDEFKKWDLNDDGFITPEEAARVQLSLKEPPSNGSLATSGYGDAAALGKGKGDRKGGFGGFGGFGKKKGGGGQ
jgi:Ca2+-binding EF-hand superfamily protein